MESIVRHTTHNDWITLAFILIGLLLLLANFIDQKRLHLLITLPFSTIFFVQYEHSKDNSIKIFNVVLSAISLMVMGLFIYLWLHKYSLQISDTNITYGFVIGLIAIYFLVKYVVSYFVAWLFDSIETYKEMVYFKTNMLLGINLYLLVLIIFAVYFFDWKGVYITWVGIIFLVLLLFRYLLFFGFLRRMPNFNLYYFILYLCAFEIAPLLLLYKWLLI